MLSCWMLLEAVAGALDVSFFQAWQVIVYDCRAPGQLQETERETMQLVHSEGALESCCSSGILNSNSKVALQLSFPNTKVFFWTIAKN